MPEDRTLLVHEVKLDATCNDVMTQSCRCSTAQYFRTRVFACRLRCDPEVPKATCAIHPHFGERVEQTHLNRYATRARESFGPCSSLKAKSGILSDNKCRLLLCLRLRESASFPTPSDIAAADTQ